MMFNAVRLAVILLGDRLVALAVRGEQVDAFAVDAENPAAALRAELNTRKIATKNVALGLSRMAVSVKPIDLPAVTGEVGDMVRFELDRHLPFPAEDAPFDFLPLPDERAGERAAGQRVLVAAADRRIVDSALKIAQEASLRPMSLTVAAHDLPALARCPRDKRVVWAHRTGGGADLLFLASGALVLSRTVPAADDATLADEIRRSLAVARWRGCDAIWLSGDGAQPPADGAFEALGGTLGEPPYTPRARACLAALPADGLGAYELALAVALAGGARPLDLLPYPLRPRRLTRPQAITLGTATVTALLVIGALFVPGYREQRYLARINAEIRRIDPEVRTVERVVNELERKRKLLATLDSLETGGLRSLPVLRELTELLPGDAWITTLALDAKGAELTGQAAAAAALIPILENSSRFERVEFASPVTRGRDREQFRIRASWETHPAQPAAAAVVPAPGRPPVVVPLEVTPPASGAPPAPGTPPVPGLPRPTAPGAQPTKPSP